jgi:hypothetical protein
MAKTAFPLSRTRSYILGARWTWRVDVLALAASEGRLLTAFEASTEQFLAMLTYRRGDVYVVVGRLEYHGHEPGLHCHSACDSLAAMQAAVVKPYGTRRFPKNKAFHRRTGYEMTQVTALETSFEFFNVTAAPDGAMV